MVTDWLFCPFSTGEEVDLPRHNTSGWVEAVHFGFNTRGRREWAVSVRTVEGDLKTEVASLCRDPLTAQEIAERASAIRATWDAAELAKRRVCVAIGGDENCARQKE